MNKTTHMVASALLVGVAAFSAIDMGLSTPAQAAIKIENKALFEAYTGMLAAGKAGNYAEALAKAKEADAIQGKPPEVTRSIHENMVAYAVNAKEYPVALAELDKMIASGEGDKNNHIKTALSIAVQLGNKDKIASYATMLGGNLDAQTRLYIAQGLENAGRHKEAIAEVQPLMQGERPSEELLRFLAHVYYDMGDAANRRAMLEQLVLYYGGSRDWHDLLLLAHNEKGLTDQQQMDIYRLRLAVGDIKTDDDYMEMAKEAMVAEFPNEAKTVLDKANAAKLLNGERANRLIKMANDSVTKDVANQADLQKQAERDPDARLKLGLILWTYGKNKEAEDAIRAAMMQKISDPDAAKMALGHVLLSSGNKADAIKSFDGISKGSKWASIGRLWAIYSRRGGDAAPAAGDDHADRRHGDERHGHGGSR